MHPPFRQRYASFPQSPIPVTIRRAAVVRSDAAYRPPVGETSSLKMSLVGASMRG